MLCWTSEARSYHTAQVRCWNKLGSGQAGNAGLRQCVEGCKLKLRTILARSKIGSTDTVPCEVYCAAFPSCWFTCCSDPLTNRESLHAYHVEFLRKKEQGFLLLLLFVLLLCWYEASSLSCLIADAWSFIAHVHRVCVLDVGTTENQRVWFNVWMQYDEFT